MTNPVPDGFAIVDFKEIVKYDRMHPVDPSKSRTADMPWEDGVKWSWKQSPQIPEEIPDPYQRMVTDPFGKMKPVEAEDQTQGSRLVSPGPISVINGCGDNNSAKPPDVNGAAGPGHLMVALNTQVKISDRSGTQISLVSLRSFWNAVDTSSAVLAPFDPRVLYDPFFSRWIVVSIANGASADASILIAVSRSSDPTGLWYFYRYDYDPSNTNWVDFPNVGYNNKWICISGNIYTNSAGAFVRSELFVFNKANLYAGSSSPALTRLINLAGNSLSPAVTHDNSSTTPLYLVSTINGNTGGNGTIRLHKVDGNVGTPVYSSITQFSTPNPWARAGSSTEDFAPQLGSINTINTFDDRIHKTIFRNGSIWCAHTIFLPAISPTRSAVQWWQLATTGGVTQVGRIESTNGFFYAFPSIEVNANNDALIGYSRFSSGTYASAAYSIRYSTDAVNSMQAPYVYKAGLAPYTKRDSRNKNRWGDYSATCLDPNNPNNFFTLQEYAELPVSGIDRWATSWANVSGSNPNLPFYVVSDVTANKAFYYSSNFDLIISNSLSTTIAGGVTNVADLSTRAGGSSGSPDYVLDGTNKKVFRSSLTGTANAVSKTLKTNTGGNLSSPTGIEVFGDSLYVLDKGGKAIYRYSLASAFTGTGNINALQKITLTSANSKAESMRVFKNNNLLNGATSIFVLDDNSPKRIYQYSLSGTLSGVSNALSGTPALSNATGLTTRLFFIAFDTLVIVTPYYGVVDKGTDTFYEYDGGSLFASGGAAAVAGFVRPLNSANLNCTGIDFSSNPGVLREPGFSIRNANDHLQLTAFPNPTTGWMNMMVRGLQPGQTKLQVFDLMGRLMQDRNMEWNEIPANEIQLDLSSFPAGNYLIAVTNGDQRKTLIVQKQ